MTNPTLLRLELSCVLGVCLIMEHGWSLEDCTVCRHLSWWIPQCFVLFFVNKEMLVYIENKSKNRRWYVFESAKISFSNHWFHEWRVKFSFVDKYIILEPLLQQTAFYWFQHSSSATIWQLYCHLRWHFPLCCFPAISFLVWDVWLLSPLLTAGISISITGAGSRSCKNTMKGW